MKATQPCTVLFAALCLLGYVCAAPTSLASDLSVDHHSSHEIEEREVDYIEPMSQVGIINQVCKVIKLSDACRIMKSLLKCTTIYIATNFINGNVPFLSKK